MENKIALYILVGAWNVGNESGAGTDGVDILGVSTNKALLVNCLQDIRKTQAEEYIGEIPDYVEIEESSPVDYMYDIHMDNGTWAQFYIIQKDVYLTSDMKTHSRAQLKEDRKQILLCYCQMLFESGNISDLMHWFLTKDEDVMSEMLESLDKKPNDYIAYSHNLSEIINDAIQKLKNSSYAATEIDWDTDDEDLDFDVLDDLDLPKTVELPNTLDIFEDDEAVTNYLSNTYGWCINSYHLKRIAK